MVSIIDLHSDLLSFLSHRNNRSIDDPLSRCSRSQLLHGDVKLQTLAIYAPTAPKSVEQGCRQIDHFLKLIESEPLAFALCRTPFDLHSPLIHFLPAFENASGFASETEPFSHIVKRLEEYVEKLGSIFYLSLCWDTENRFGGGNRSTAGLKADGKQLLQWMDGRRIALDFSHSSDRLAYDLLEYIDQHNLAIPILASHSNFRAISDYPRNLPDPIAKEIIRRKGLIGLNLFAPFIHPTDPSAIFRHIEYGLSLGAQDALCFGADFFCDVDFPHILEKYQRQTAFFPEWSNASVYPSLLTSCREKLHLSDDLISKMAHGNALRFLQERIFSIESIGSSI